MLIVFALGIGNVVIYLLDLDRDLREHVFREQVAIILATVPLSDDGRNLGLLPHRFSQSDWRYSLYRAEGELVATSPPGLPPLPFVPAGGSDLELRQPVMAEEVGPDRVLVMSRNDWDECEELCQIFRERLASSTLLLSGLACISLVSMYLLAGWMLRSVQRAAELGSLIGVRHPDRRIPLEELPTEIVPLARSANEAMDRLATAYHAERRFTSDAAHELRTPLAVLGLRLQKARQEGAVEWDVLDRDMLQMKRLVDQLLALARADSEAMPSDTGHSRLSRVIRETVADILPLYEAAGRSIQVELEDEVYFKTGAEPARHVLRNILENALYHGSGAVTVRLLHGPSGTYVDVADEGPPRDPNEFEEMFQRFRKGRQSESGSGLGLAIVRRTMENIGGSACILSAQNFTVRLTFPPA
ncbi:sensor histidine kinase [Neorhizobium sp. DAR64860/K0K1]|uniref:sensor histidine kinase n=1 Tax=Neorhizobium sp. DAR64860/K0K1 TaxID=3421955 RepID=UPI003D2B076D